MTRLKIWRNDFKKYSPSKGFCGFNYYLHELGIKSNLWPKVFMIMIYLTGNNAQKSIAEIYDKKGNAIKQ